MISSYFCLLQWAHFEIVFYTLSLFYFLLPNNTESIHGRKEIISLNCLLENYNNPLSFPKKIKNPCLESRTQMRCYKVPFKHIPLPKTMHRFCETSHMQVRLAYEARNIWIFWYSLAKYMEGQTPNLPLNLVQLLALLLIFCSNVNHSLRSTHF